MSADIQNVCTIRRRTTCRASLHDAQLSRWAFWRSRFRSTEPRDHVVFPAVLHGRSMTALFWHLWPSCLEWNVGSRAEPDLVPIEFRHALNLRCYAPAPNRRGIRRCFCLTSVCLTSVAYIGPKSRTERPWKTKIGREVVHVTRDSDTTFMVKRKN